MTENNKAKNIKNLRFRYIAFVLSILKSEYNIMEHKLNYYYFQCILAQKI